MTRRPALAVVLAVVALLLAACSGVPRTSAVQTVEPVDVGEPSIAPVPGPQPGAEPRDIVTSFLEANAVGTDDHSAARRYLTAAARQDWTDTTATIINANSRSVGNFEKGTVVVTGRPVGSLTQNGIYQPQLQGSGDGGAEEQFSFRVVKVDGQYRIADLPPGLLLTTDDFATNYRQHALWFFDQAKHYLVPDPRWSALRGAALARWLVGQLSAGPRPDLASSVTTDTVPPEAGGARITVRDGSPLRVEVPGAAQLESRAKRLLAAQVATTVTDPTSTEPVVLTDGGQTVPMPGESDPSFTAAGLFSTYQPSPPAADVFYLANGALVRDDGAKVGGRLDTAPYFLDSVAVTRPGGGPDLTVAGVVSGGRLVIGTQSAGFRTTTVRGQLSRPAWAPAPSPDASAPPEVWIGVGGRLERVEVRGNIGTPSVVSVNAGAGGGRIVAVRVSPEGSRVALVIESPNGSRRLYVGGIVRSPGQVRIDALPSISPEGVSIDDAAWIGSQKLIAIGAVTATGDPRIFETGVDGSFWTSRGIGSVLPGRPDSITAAVGQFAWVSAGQSVWRQAGRGWASPGRADTTVFGDKPVYLE